MEHWDICDSQGKPTGRTIAKGGDFAPGEYHIAVEAWIVNSAGQYLIQKRSSCCQHYPDMWSLTAGRIQAGEEPARGCIREVEEEIGLHLEEEELIHLSHINREDGSHMIWEVYLVKREAELSELVLDPQEVGEVRWVSGRELEQMILTEEIFVYPEMLDFLYRIDREYLGGQNFGGKNQETYRRFLNQMTEFIFAEDEPKQADIIFVPGSGFPQIGERAAALYRKGYAPFVLPSGRYSVTEGKFTGVREKRKVYNGSYETEWEFLRDVLLKNGVPSEAVLREDEATFTYENAIRSRNVTDRKGMEIKRGIICCKPAHARRSLLYYQLLYPETELLVCPAEGCGITKDNWFLSEAGYSTVLGEITRCGSQFHEIFGRILCGEKLDEVMPIK